MKEKRERLIQDDVARKEPSLEEIPDGQTLQRVKMIQKSISQNNPSNQRGMAESVYEERSRSKGSSVRTVVGERIRPKGPARAFEIFPCMFFFVDAAYAVVPKCNSK